MLQIYPWPEKYEFRRFDIQKKLFKILEVEQQQALQNNQETEYKEFYGSQKSDKISHVPIKKVNKWLNNTHVESFNGVI